MAGALPQCTHEIEIRENSPRNIEAKWILTGVHHMQRGDSINTTFNFSEFDCMLQMDQSESDYIRFSVTCFRPEAEHPRVQCQVFLKSNEETLLEIPIREEDYHVTHDGTILFCKLPWAEISSESFFPEEVLTVIFQLRQTEGPPRIISESRHGRLHISWDSPTVMQIKWTVENFFNLPCELGKGVISKDFSFPGGNAFLSLHPYGKHDKPNRIILSVIFTCPIGRGLRNPELDCEVTLRTVDGSHYSRLVSEDVESLQDCGGYFERFFKYSEVFDRKESILPGGVLTACIKLSSRGGSARKPKSDSK